MYSPENPSKPRVYKSKKKECGDCGKRRTCVKRYLDLEFIEKELLIRVLYVHSPEDLSKLRVYKSKEKEYGKYMALFYC